MNGAARAVILKAVMQLEVERHLLLRRNDALAAEMRDCDTRIDAIALERSDLLTVTGGLSAEERAMIASARDFPAPAPPARRASRPRKAVAAPRSAAGPRIDAFEILPTDIVF